MATNPTDPAALGRTIAGASELADVFSKLKSAIKENEDQLKQLGYSGVQLGKALLSSEQGMSKYNSGIINGTKGISDLISKFGPLGSAVGLVIRTFGGLTASILSQNDAYLKAKDSLNQFGFSSQMTASEIAAMGREAGYTKDELEKYTGAITSLGTDMLSLGKTFGQGSQVFMKQIANVGVDTITTFSKLGISQEQLTKNQAHYIRLLSMQGIQVTDQMKAGDQLKKQSLDYTTNLLTLAALSGEEIESIKRKQDAARADMNFQIGQAMKAKEAADLESRAGDQEAQARARRLRAEITANEKMQDIAMTMGLSGQELSAFSQMIQTGTFTELSAKFAPFGSELLTFIKDVQEGRRDANGLAIQLAKMTDRTLDAVGTAATLNASEIQSAIQLNADQIKRAAQLRGMSEEDYIKMVKAEIENRKKNAEKDPLANIRADQIKIEKAAQLAMENFTEYIRGPIMKGLEMFQKAVMWVGRGLLKLYKMLPGTDKDATQKLIDALTPVSELEEQLEKINKREREFLATGGSSLVSPEERSATISSQLAEFEQQRQTVRSQIAQRTGDAGYRAIHGMPSEPLSGGPRRLTQASLRDMYPGVIRSTGDVHLADGGDVDPRILAVLSRLGAQGWFQPEGVTSINDNFHQGMNSKHTRGQAIDFKVREYNPDVLAAVKSFVNDFPGLKLIDEYANPSANATGKHFHLEVGARRGIVPGMFDAPTSGTLMAVHNREMIAPLDPNSIIAKLLTASPDEARAIMNTASNSDVAEMIVSGFGELGNKLDTLIGGISDLNNTQEEALIYTRA